MEDRAIANRHDVNIHLDELCKAEIISNEMVKNMRHSANQSKIVKNYEKLCSGATYIPIEVAVSFQEDERDRTIKITRNNTNNQRNGIQLSFNRYWPYYIYPCQSVQFFVAFETICQTISTCVSTADIIQICLFIILSVNGGTVMT